MPPPGPPPTQPFMLPKVAPNLPPPMYMPMYPSAFAGGLPNAALTQPPPTQFNAGHFLAQAWSGGRKDAHHTTPILHTSLPTAHKNNSSGMVSKHRATAAPPGESGRSSHTHSKIPYRTQIEASPVQAREKVENLIAQGKKVMLIMRGLPGSGKSTVAA